MQVWKDFINGYALETTLKLGDELRVRLIDLLGFLYFFCFTTVPECAKIHIMKNKYISIYTNIGTNDKHLRLAIYTVHSGICFYTGRRITPEEMHIDHIKPVSKGGKDCIANYVLSCGQINIRKKDKYSEKFGKVVTELNILLFAESVLQEYIEREIGRAHV